MSAGRELRRVDGLLAIGFGAGLAPKAPGTFGTLIAIPAAVWMLTFAWPAQLAIIAVVVAPGFLICHGSARRLGVADHPAIVYDEIAGFLIACFALPLSWLWIVAAFLLFRVLDIAKPWPISWADRRLRGGVGIMMDDLLAGAGVALLLHLARYVTSLV